MEEEKKSNKIWLSLIQSGLSLTAGGIKKYYKRNIFRPRRRTGWFIGIAVFLTIILIFLIWAYSLDYGKNQKMEFNVSFSAPYAIELGLDWKEVYLAMLADLKPKKVRIPVYWNLLEPTQGRIKFEWVDWQIVKAKEYGAEVVLVLGRRVPRWPECHEPLWLKGKDEKEKNSEVLRLLKDEVDHFKKFDNIVMWQVENEALFNFFGECPKMTQEFVKEEMAVVRSLDDRPIMITDSGEMSAWERSGPIAEVLGTTLYRVVWNPWTSFFHHVWPPAFYYNRAWFVKNTFGVKDIIISELQAEPWAIKERFISQVPLKDQYRAFDIEQFKENVRFAEKTGLGQAYLWGVEWWYWIREVHGNSDYWEYAKSVINR